MLLTPAEQEALFERARAHATALTRVPCARFDGFPFALKEGGGVWVRAVLERFGLAQQIALVRRLNELFRMHRGGVPHMLRARFLSGGIELVAEEPALSSELLALFDRAVWGAVDYEAFAVEARISWEEDVPFGGTAARMVTFKAGTTVPLFVMVHVLRLLEEEELGLGAVIVCDRNGLPRDRGAYFALNAWRESE